MSYTLATIVEGHGDVTALPILLRRLEPAFHVPRPIRVSRSKLLDNDELKRYLTIAQANILEGGGNGGVLLVFDADDDCAAKLGPKQVALMDQSTGKSCVCACVLAVREFEAWLIAGDTEHIFTANVESKRDAKNILKQWYGKYAETADQPGLTGRMNLDLARQRCASFRYLESVIDRFRAAANIQASSGGVA